IYIDLQRQLTACQDDAYKEERADETHDGTITIPQGGGDGRVVRAPGPGRLFQDERDGDHGRRGQDWGWSRRDDGVGRSRERAVAGFLSGSVGRSGEAPSAAGGQSRYGGDCGTPGTGSGEA